MDASTPAELGTNYVVKEVIGRGGMGVVYRCVDRRTGQTWAVKQMVPGQDGHALVEQFRLEARLLSQLQHPNLPRVVDYFEDGRAFYLVMDLFSGLTLRHLLEASADPPVIGQSLRWIDSILDVLTYLHSQRPPVLYRDLSPQNIVIERDNTLRLVDFGLARQMAPDQRTTPALRGFGSTGYAPPEQYGQATTTMRSDLYGVAATAYHLFTGQVPPDAMSLLMGRVKLEAPHRLNPNLAEPISRWVLKGMAVRAQDRYPTAEDMRSALRAACMEAVRAGRPEHKLDNPITAVRPQPRPVDPEQFVERLWEHLRIFKWTELKPPPPFQAAYGTQPGRSQRQAEAYVAFVERLDDKKLADLIDAAEDLRREILRRPGLAGSFALYFVLCGKTVVDPASVSQQVTAHTQTTTQHRATIFLAVDLQHARAFGEHVGEPFANSGDLSDLLLNVEIALRVAASA